MSKDTITSCNGIYDLLKSHLFQQHRQIAMESTSNFLTIVIIFYYLGKLIFIHFLKFIKLLLILAMSKLLYLKYASKFVLELRENLLYWQPGSQVVHVEIIVFMPHYKSTFRY